METANLTAKIIGPGEGHWIESPSERRYAKLSACDTGGLLQLAELTVEPGDGPPYHIHELEDEIWYILEGEVEFTVDGKKTIVGPGTTVFGPRGVPHRFQGAGDKTAKFIIMITGENFEQFYARWGELSASGNLTPETGTALAAEHGIRFL